MRVSAYGAPHHGQPRRPRRQNLPRGFGGIVLADGAARAWRPLYWRNWRRLELGIGTQDKALTVEVSPGDCTERLFARLATLDTGDPVHQRTFDLGWRTPRLCAHETYMDCPYHEPPQRAGDARIQRLFRHTGAVTPG